MKKHPSSTILPPAPDIVNERGPKQNFEAYKADRKASNKAIRERLKGFLVHLSNEMLFDEQRRPIALRFKRGKTFTGSTAFLQLV
jgi:hypothetical protein